MITVVGVARQNSALSFRSVTTFAQMILIDSWIWFGCQSMASMGYCIHDSKSYRIFLSAYLHRGSCYSCSIIFAMACCGAPSSTPLAQYARSLRTQLEGEKLPMLFPMYTVPSWVASSHPDPECKQMRILQDALKEMMGNLKSIPVDLLSEGQIQI